MSTKQEIETWVAALALYDKNNLEASIVAFRPLADTSKVLFNCGLMCATLGAHKNAIEYYDRAIKLDTYLSIAYFQKGVSNFLQENFEDALADFNNALTYMRGNKWIDYEQLGLKYKLWSCEIRFNRGLCYMYLQDTNTGMHDMVVACREKGDARHDVIDEAIRDKAEGYVVFSIPSGCVFRPNESKIRNIMTRDYLGKARLVASSKGPSRMPSRTNSVADSVVQSPNSSDPNAILPGFRARQHSEPPLSRRAYQSPSSLELRTSVDTRPPSGSTIQGATGKARSQSVDRRPSQLDLGAAAFNHDTSRSQARTGAVRSASERPATRRLDRESIASETSNQSSEATEPRVATRDSEPRQGRHRHSNSSRDALSLLTRFSHRRPLSVEEEAEDEENDGSPSVTTPANSVNGIQDKTRNVTPPKRNPVNNNLQMKSIRLKIHFKEDTRFLVIPAEYSFVDLSETIVRKLATKGTLKLKTRDEEGDMITIADQEDLEVAALGCRESALKGGREMGKLEVWITENVTSQGRESLQ